MSRAMPSARAGRPTARAMLRCLGYSATIAIAGCGKIGPDFGSLEASDRSYATVGTIANQNWGSSAMARKALSDGKLTQGEYDAIMDKFDADRTADAAQAKADALRRWGRTASGMGASGQDAQRLEAKPASPAPQEDAQ